MSPLPRLRTRKQVAVNVATEITLLCAKMAFNVAPLPFGQAASMILQEIANKADGIKFHKNKAKQFQTRCLRLMEEFESDNFNDGEYIEMLQGLGGRLKMDLVDVYKRLLTISTYDLVDSFLYFWDIKEALDVCTEMLFRIEFQFTREAQIVAVGGIQHIFAQASHQHDEQKTLLHEQTAQLQEQSAQIHELLSAVKTMASDVQIRAVLGTEPELAQQVLAVGEMEARLLLEESQVNEGEIHEFERRLRELQIPRTWANLTNDIDAPQVPVACGLTSKIYISTFKTHCQSTKVALKSFDGPVFEERKKRLRRFTREVIAWSNLKQRNIVPFYGIYEHDNRVFIVSQWQENRDLRRYLEHISPNANRLSLLCGAAQGLEYLHNELVIHGNVKCSNILISAEGVPKLCDFRLSHVNDFQDFSAQSTQSMAYNHRWTAPERHTDEDIWTGPTKPSDIYSLSMTILECITLKNPFDEYRTDYDAMEGACSGDRPKRPISPPEVQRWLSDDLWNLMEKMWHQDPGLRGDIGWVVSRLKVLAAEGAGTNADITGHAIGHKPEAMTDSVDRSEHIKGFRNDGSFFQARKRGLRNHERLPDTRTGGIEARFVSTSSSEPDFFPDDIPPWIQSSPGRDEDTNVTETIFHSFEPTPLPGKNLTAFDIRYRSTDEQHVLDAQFPTWSTRFSDLLRFFGSVSLF